MGTELVTLDQVLDMSEKLKPSDQLRLISVLSERLRREMEPDGAPVDMLSLAGLWAGVDAAAYREQERSSWEA